MGKLDRVPNQINQNLAQASGVALQRFWKIRSGIQYECKASLPSFQRHHFHQRGDRLVEFEIALVQLEFACLYL